MTRKPRGAGPVRFLCVANWLPGKGIDLLAARIGPLVDLIDDGTEGFLVEPGDTDALTEALDRLASDAGPRARCSEAALRRACTLPTWSDSEEKFCALIESIAVHQSNPAQFSSGAS